MAKEPTTVTPAVSGKVSNPLDIKWPQDTFGFTSMLRKEGTRAIGRIKGDTEKLAVLIQTLKVLGEHARAKVEDQTREIERDAAASRNRREAEYVRSLSDLKANAAHHQTLAVRAEEAVKKKEAGRAK